MDRDRLFGDWHSEAFGFPRWWHPNGYKMKVVECGPDHLIIRGSAAEVSISRGDPDYWSVTWGIRHGGDASVGGTVAMRTGTLRDAFGLIDAPEHDEIAAKFGADVMFRGKFIRRGDFLNIPCPGIGYVGDPNVSIEVDNVMREAVRTLLG